MNKTNHIKTYQVTRLVMLRKTHDLSQNELAKRTGLSPAAISLLAKGDTEPTLNSAITLCNVFDISLDVFTGRKEYPNNKPAIQIEPVKQTLSPIKNLMENNAFRSRYEHF